MSDFPKCKIEIVVDNVPNIKCREVIDAIDDACKNLGYKVKDATAEIKEEE
jgi:hypothetical protein